MKLALELSKQDAAWSDGGAAGHAESALSSDGGGAEATASSGETEETSAESDDRASPSDELEDAEFQTSPKPETDTERSLCEMGYPLQMVRQALRKTNGDLQRAAAIWQVHKRSNLPQYTPN